MCRLSPSLYLTVLSKGAGLAVIVGCGRRPFLITGVYFPASGSAGRLAVPPVSLGDECRAECFPPADAEGVLVGAAVPVGDGAETALVAAGCPPGVEAASLWLLAQPPSVRAAMAATPTARARCRPRSALWLWRINTLLFPSTLRGSSAREFAHPETSTSCRRTAGRAGAIRPTRDRCARSPARVRSTRASPEVAARHPGHTPRPPRAAADGG